VYNRTKLKISLCSCWSTCFKRFTSTKIYILKANCSCIEWL